MLGGKTVTKTWRQNPDGHLIHDGDCYFWGHCVCTCGLLHHLRPMSHRALNLVPDLFKQVAVQSSVVDSLFDSDLIRKAKEMMIEPDRPLTAEENKRLEAILRAAGFVGVGDERR